MIITKYKDCFDEHILYFFYLAKLDRVCVFVNGLNDHIKYIVKAYILKPFWKLMIGHKFGKPRKDP
jgi:hypothetical protein